MRYMTLTTIPVQTETREALKYRGKKGETYDEILRRLLALTENMVDAGGVPL